MLSCDRTSLKTGKCTEKLVILGHPGLKGIHYYNCMLGFRLSFMSGCNVHETVSLSQFLFVCACTWRDKSQQSRHVK